MPIVQSRVIALLDALASYRNAMDEAVKIINSNYTLYRQGNQTAEQALDQIVLNISYSELVKDKSTSDTTFQVESIRFGPARRKHNERAAQRAHSKRAVEEYRRLQTVKTLYESSTDLPEISPESAPPSPSYEEEYPESKTHCMVCMKPLDSPYCGLSPEVLGSGECHQGKRANLNPSII